MSYEPDRELAQSSNTTRRRAAFRSVRFLAATVSTFVRHGVVLAAATVVGSGLWAALYVALLCIAAISGGGAGSPLTFPAGLLGILVLSVVLGGGIFAFASGAGSLACSFFRLPKISAIPLAFVGGFLLTWWTSWFWAAVLPQFDPPPFLQVASFYLLYLTVPLGAYWWLTEGPLAVVDACYRLLQRQFSRSPLTHCEPESAPSS